MALTGHSLGGAVALLVEARRGPNPTPTPNPNPNPNPHWLVTARLHQDGFSILGVTSYGSPKVKDPNPNPNPNPYPNSDPNPNSNPRSRIGPGQSAWWPRASRSSE